MIAYSLILPAYNEEAHLPGTLASVHAAMRMVPEPGEVIVVDNNSTDRTAAVAQANGARVVFEPVNQISRARNAGARAALGTWLIFLDADTQLPAGLLVRAIENLRSGSIAGGGALMEMDRPITPRYQRVVDCWTWVSRKLQWAAGSFVYCTKEGFDAVGGFSLKVYAGEEVFFSRAYTKWARQHGKTFRIIDSPRVVTSARKMEWYSPAQLLGLLLMMALIPYSVRSKRLCAFWYKRPKGSPMIDNNR
jgi:glycosyltransferase involved in cell wall biosynthesis